MDTQRSEGEKKIGFKLRIFRFSFKLWNRGKVRIQCNSDFPDPLQKQLSDINQQTTLTYLVCIGCDLYVELI